MNAENELDCLRRAIGRNREFQCQLGLSKGEARLLALLYKRERVSREALAAVYCTAGKINLDSIKVAISRIRKKLPSGTGVVKDRKSYKLLGKDKVEPYIERI